MSRTILGKVGMTPKGAWNTATQYKRLDVVTHNGCSFVALQDNKNVEPADGEIWQIVAYKGEFTEEQLQDFKNTVVRESKQDIDNYTEEKESQLNNIAENVEDMVMAMQFANFRVDDNMHLNIVQAEKMSNTSFVFDENTGRMGVIINE